MPSRTRAKLKPPSVLIIYTGGTFGMMPQKGSSRLRITELSAAALKRNLLRAVPELAQLAQCDVDIAMNIDSAHMDSRGWVNLAKRIQSQWKDYDGFVILHGTDTLSYTASALSFLLQPCHKPVVITGAQRPLSALRTDARRNLISAVEIAAHGPRPLTQQVLVFFDDRLYQGNRTRKRSALEFEAFESPHFPPLAVVGTTIQYQTLPPAAPMGRARANNTPMKPQFSSAVAMLHVTPEFPAHAIREGLLSKVRGLVLVIFPSGTAPTHQPEFIELLRQAKVDRIPVVLVTESSATLPGPSSSLGTYEAGRAMQREGCYWAPEMTPECAFVKTAWILGQPAGSQDFAQLWERDFAREGCPTKGDQ